MIKRPNPITEETLPRMFHIGMGRAILFLMQQDPSRYRDLILDSCLHNRAYDPYLEHDRADYIYPLIRRPGEADWYLQRILEALDKAADTCDTEQLMDFAMLFARDGAVEAREALYSKFLKTAAAGEFDGGEQIIKLDGMNGFLFVADTMGTYPSSCHYYPALRTAEDVCGIESTFDSLKEAAKTNPHILDFVAGLDTPYSLDWSHEDLLLHRSKPRLPWTQPDLEDVTWAEMKDRTDFKRWIFRWARTASDDEILNAAKDFPSCEDVEGLREHLAIFWRRPYPLDPAPIIELLDHRDESVVNAAFNALENIQNSKVRKLFFRFERDLEWSPNAIGLLKNNYEPGDYGRILRILHLPLNDDALHIAGVSTRDVFDENPEPDALDILLFLYNHGPCSMCRYGTVKSIQELTELPDWMIEECRYDADAGLRELAGNG